MREAGVTLAERTKNILSPQLRGLARRLIAFAFYYSGLYGLYAAHRLRGRAVVLMYHRVLPPDADTCSTDGIVVTPTTFAMHMAFLRNHFSPLTPQQLERGLTQGSFPDRACLVTFDDGWFDNERYALPVLQQFQVPAVFFVATAYIGTNRTFWQEELTRLIASASKLPQARETLRALGIEESSSSTEVNARRLARNAVSRLKASPTSHVKHVRDQLVTELAKQGISTNSYGDDYFMTWDQIRLLAEQPLATVASHAHSHVPLTRLGRDGAAMDLSHSLKLLEHHGLPPQWMCAYPDGAHDADVISVARSLGLRTAMTTIHGHVQVNDNPMILRRINLHEEATSTRAEFACRLIGLL